MLPCNGKMPIPSLETIIDPDFAEKIVNNPQRSSPQDGILFLQGEPADSLYFVKAVLRAPSPFGYSMENQSLWGS
jgi:hypothetical protein